MAQTGLVALVVGAKCIRSGRSDEDSLLYRVGKKSVTVRNGGAGVETGAVNAGSLNRERHLSFAN